MKHLKTFESYGEVTSETNTIDSVIDKVKKSHDSGWYGEHLVESTECVNLDNGWDDDLETLKDVPGVAEILQKISDNQWDLWEGSLEETFTCILTESLYEDGERKYEEGPLLVKYNGWYEDLMNLGSKEIED
ncbi:MAG: hypothetical protein SLAVMIC_00402 [uncultured marine phage]|uniref:Uncharacterized protein n=1 Tax=uncultured marine phage TaxID=707152 RepID=A0A8D9FQR4_9VIRU|nr:MAG: hypothetical protein SLAVMIC_00402 [uncultured marine phage]